MTNSRRLFPLFALHALFTSGVVSEEVQLKTSDEKTVQALLFGKGETGLILCHGRRYFAGGETYRDQCEYLQEKGLRCLALSFRGYPSKAPPNLPGREHDIEAAFDHLVKVGARRVYVLGSSMGGFAVLDALELLRKKPQLSGIIIVSAYHPTACRTSKIPKLFVAAEDDQTFYPKVLATHRHASDPKLLITYPKGGHGQMLFKSHGEDLLEKIVKFTKAGS